jgi:hypothetical protein
MSAVIALLQRGDLDPQLRLQWGALHADRQRQRAAQTPRSSAITRPIRAIRDLFNR